MLVAFSHAIFPLNLADPCGNAQVNVKVSRAWLHALGGKIPLDFIKVGQVAADFCPLCYFGKSLPMKALEAPFSVVAVPASETLAWLASADDARQL